MSLEPLEHSVLGAPLDQRDVSSSDGGLRIDSLSACCPSVVSDDHCCGGCWLGGSLVSDWLGS